MKKILLSLILVVALITPSFVYAGATQIRKVQLGNDGFKVYKFTRATDAGDAVVPYTGVGFKPSSAIFIVYVSGNSNGIGFSDGTTEGGYIHYGGSSWDIGSDKAIMIYSSSGATGVYGSLTSFDADGFTITYTHAGTLFSGTMYVRVILFR